MEMCKDNMDAKFWGLPFPAMSSTPKAQTICQVPMKSLVGQVVLFETNSELTPENGWLEYDRFLFGARPIFIVSGRGNVPVQYGMNLINFIQSLPIKDHSRQWLGS